MITRFYYYLEISELAIEEVLLASCNKPKLRTTDEFRVGKHIEVVKAHSI
jgi:hypothetical protein